MKHELFHDDFVPVNVNIDDLVNTLEHDHAGFIKTFLYEQDGIEEGVPDFHKWISALMNSTTYTKICIAIPRAHAKTTIAKLTAIHHFIYSKTRFLVYLSNTSTIAAAAVKDIADFIRTPLCEQIYGPAVFTQAEEAKGNYTFHWRGKLIVMRALGAGQQIRGMNVNNQRPDLAIVDDLENAQEGEKSKLGYTKLKEWFYGTFMPAMDKRRNKIIQIGNLVSTKSILRDHLKSSLWKSVCLGVLTSDGEPLWPQQWDLASLRLNLINYMQEGQLHIWLAEMMNMPVTEANSLLANGKLKLADVVNPYDDDVLMRCITVDPAISENLRHADSAAITVHGYHRDGYWFAMERDSMKGANPYQLYNSIMRLAIKWRVGVIGIESVAYQKSLIHIAEHENARAGYKGFQFVELKAGKASKTSRILTWVGMLNRGLYRLTMNDFDMIQQISDYDIESKSNKDDEIDCTSYIVYMVDNYLTQIANITSPIGDTQDAVSTVHY